jgi:hypothetical protein
MAPFSKIIFKNALLGQNAGVYWLGLGFGLLVGKGFDFYFLVGFWWIALV